MPIDDWLPQSKLYPLSSFTISGFGKKGLNNDLTITGDEGVTLGTDVTVNGTLAVNGSALYTDGHTLTLASSATMQENGYTVVGNVTVDRVCAQSANETFGGIGVEINAAEAEPGATTILRVTGTPETIDGVQGVARVFDITPTVNTGLNATLVVHYDESELNGILEETLALYYSDDGGDHHGFLRFETIVVWPDGVAQPTLPMPIG